MPVTVPRYNIDDLERFPDDGNRYELLDGLLLVTPAPLPPHQVVISRIPPPQAASIAAAAMATAQGRCSGHVMVDPRQEWARPLPGATQ